MLDPDITAIHLELKSTRVDPNGIDNLLEN